VPLLRYLLANHFGSNTSEDVELGELNVETEGNNGETEEDCEDPEADIWSGDFTTIADSERLLR